MSSFAALYGATFLAPPTPFSDLGLKDAWDQKSDQLSIRRLNLSKLEELLESVWPEAIPLLCETIARDALRSDEDDSGPSDDEEAFSPSLSDNRQSTMRSIKARRGQKKFRRAMLRRYRGKCALTACGCEDLLEAAHIAPYRGEAFNHPSNGILFRADVHTLFDLNLMGLDPDDFTAHFHPIAADHGYAQFEGLRLNALIAARPNNAALRLKWAAFRDYLTDNAG